jgi:hypothetical protein
MRPTQLDESCESRLHSVISGIVRKRALTTLSTLITSLTNPIPTSHEFFDHQSSFAGYDEFLAQVPPDQGIGLNLLSD